MAAEHKVPNTKTVKTGKKDFMIFASFGPHLALKHRIQSPESIQLP